MEAVAHNEPLEESTSAQPAPDAPCVHCGLPVGEFPVGEGPYFCCTGCELVHDALAHAGYSDTFYQLSALTPDKKGRTPVNRQQNDLHLLTLDTEDFLENHTRPLSGSLRKVVLFLDGVHCAACVWLVERLPLEIEGVQLARLDLSRSQVTIHFDPTLVQLSRVATWLARFGYHAYPLHQRQRNDKTSAERRLLIKAGVSWALAGNVMLFAFAMYAGLDLEMIGDASNTALASGARWASMVLALVSVTYGGSEFFRNAWASIGMTIRLKQLQGLHMDTPISLGILVGFSYGFWATITGRGEVWFDSITMLIAALLTARWLQMRSYRLAGDATDRLLNLIPSMARRIRRADADQFEEGVPADVPVKDVPVKDVPVKLVRVETLKRDDLIAVPAGEVFPVDGAVISGSSIVDKSVLTGESRPEKLTPGMEIQAGVTNLHAPVYVRVVATGENTRVGKLLSWVGEQSLDRAPVILLADRLSGYFVGTLLLLALATGIGWYFVDPGQIVARVVALLVISCPCALGMATPLAMSIASGRAARRGIFIKSNQATQQLAEIDAVVIDKTGTLTEGRMAVIEQVGDEEAVRLAGLLELHSSHPIAKAITKTIVDATHAARYADTCVPGSQEIHDMKWIHGCGVQGTVEGREVKVGQPAWISQDAESNEWLAEQLRLFAAAGYTPVGVAVDGQLAAALAVGDKIRDDAHMLLDSLKQEGKTIYLLSGDHPDVVQHVAGLLDIPDNQAIGGVSPEGKKKFVEELRENKGQVVAMVGDGVNDAAALQAANVGIAVEGGSTPSQVAADVFLTRKGLKPVIDTFRGAENVMRVIRKNLVISLTYNILGASAAILGFVTPLVAAIAMPISSLVVVVVSILQRSFKVIDQETKRLA